MSTLKKIPDFGAFQWTGGPLRFVPVGRLTLAFCVTVDRLTIAEVDVSVCPPLKRRADRIAKSYRLFEASDPVCDCCW
ncbi:hypothetical protein M513_09999 [Trichuris suis]|uniref:Uncharacterized protein n=1 Tax=Trichuris suis TaxID=68888 RepID=A0A085LW29_9BILA|nr:hypothetical protein M513_09999 [Trichuris suis]